jgi:hypothetical protein
MWLAAHEGYHLFESSTNPAKELTIPMKKIATVVLFAVGMGPFMVGSSALAQGEVIYLLTQGGEGTASLECSCSELPFIGCAVGTRVDKVVPFILPPGYRKGEFSPTVAPKGLHAGGNVQWLNDDPHDGRVKLHCWADAYSSATISVSAVTATHE